MFNGDNLYLLLRKQKKDQSKLNLDRDKYNFNKILI